MKTGWEKKELTGSYTVEAACILPIVLFCMLFLIRTGFSLALQVKELAASLPGIADGSEAERALEWLRMTGMLKEVIH